MTHTSKHTDKPKLPRGRRGATPKDDNQNQATGEDLGREGLGIAAKE